MHESTFDEMYKDYSISISKATQPNIPINLEELKNNANKEKRKRKFGDPATDTYLGPWAPFDYETQLNSEIEQQQQVIREKLEEEEKVKAEEKAKEISTAASTPVPPNTQKVVVNTGGDDDDSDPLKERILQTRSIYHGNLQDFKDYQGRSFVDHPSDMKPMEHECFLPKKLVHTWTGHTKGVSAIRFFPKYGHLLLSASMDTTVKIWDVHNKQKCLRTYMGHTKAVRDICFSNDGRRFLTCGYDKYILLWDTETGQCIGSYFSGKIPYCVKFNPEKDKNHFFLAGYSDKRILQWDTNTGKVSQKYNQHLGPVNTITFIDDNRRFVSSSDDKSLRIWDWGIPVVIKYVSEPHMHSMPSISVHPDGNSFACQSLDNQILIYGARDKFRLNRKKRFAGHEIAGYACQVNFSPDGHWIMSGDSEGKVWFWDWNTCRKLKVLNCHDGVCIGCEWHPLEPSKIATCGWDGTIKYWD